MSTKNAIEVISDFIRRGELLEGINNQGMVHLQNVVIVQFNVLIDQLKKLSLMRPLVPHDKLTLTRLWDGLLWSYDQESGFRVEKYRHIDDVDILEVKLRKRGFSTNDTKFLTTVHSIIFPYFDPVTWVIFDLQGHILIKGRYDALYYALKLMSRVTSLCDIVIKFKQSPSDLIKLSEMFEKRTGSSLINPDKN